MKKILFITLLIMLVLTGAVSAKKESDDICILEGRTIILNNRTLDSQVLNLPLISVNNTTYLSVKDMAVIMGRDAEWYEQVNSVQLVQPIEIIKDKEGKMISIIYDYFIKNEDTALKIGKAVAMENFELQPKNTSFYCTKAAHMDHFYITWIDADFFGKSDDVSDCFENCDYVVYIDPLTGECKVSTRDMWSSLYIFPNYRSYAYDPDNFEKRKILIDRMKYSDENMIHPLVIYEDYTYISVRDVASMLDKEVVWIPEREEIQLNQNKAKPQLITKEESALEIAKAFVESVYKYGSDVSVQYDVKYVPCNETTPNSYFYVYVRFDDEEFDEDSYILIDAYNCHIETFGLELSEEAAISIANDVFEEIKIEIPLLREESFDTEEFFPETSIEVKETDDGMCYAVSGSCEPIIPGCRISVIIRKSDGKILRIVVEE